MIDGLGQVHVKAPRVFADEARAILGENE